MANAYQSRPPSTYSGAVSTISLVDVGDVAAETANAYSMRSVTQGEVSAAGLLTSDSYHFSHDSAATTTRWRSSSRMVGSFGKPGVEPIGRSFEHRSR